eukprot:SAG31_NODE_5283_length_2633_cov_1.701263_2_plen_53_part_00
MLRGTTVLSASRAATLLSNFKEWLEAMNQISHRNFKLCDAEDKEVVKALVVH